MGGNDQQTQDALERIASVEKRLAALQELALDTAALRSQLAFAQTRLLEGAIGDADRICEEVMATARRMAQGSGDNRVRTGRITRDELAEEVREVLGKGLFAKLLAEHQGGGDPRTEARLATFDSNVREYLQASQRKTEEGINQTRGELQRAIEMLRGEIAMIRRAPGEPLQVTGLDQVVATMAGSQQEGTAALTAAVEALGERLATRLAEAQAEQARQTEAWVTAVRQQVQELKTAPADPAPAIAVLERIASGLEHPAAAAVPAVGGEIQALVQALIQANATVADTVRDGLKELGTAIAERPAGQEGLAAGLERLATVLDRPVAADPAPHPVATALRDGLQELGATLAGSHGAADAAGVVAGLERIATVLDRQVPADTASGVPMAFELRALSQTLGDRLDKGETIAQAVRDGLSAMGQALSASRGGIEQIETRATLQAGLERIAQALEQRSSTAPEFAPVVAELKALEDSLGGGPTSGDTGPAAIRDGFRELVQALGALKSGEAPPAVAWSELVDRLVAALAARPDTAAASAPDGAVAAAVREGFHGLTASLAECATVTAPSPLPAALLAAVERIAQGVESRAIAVPASTDGAGASPDPHLGGEAVAAAVREGLKELSQSLAARGGVAATDVQDVAQALDVVCQRLDHAHERVAASIEAGLARVAESLASRPSAGPVQGMGPSEGDDFPALAPNAATPPGHDSRVPTQLISEHDTTRLAHQVTTGRMAIGSATGVSSVSKVGIDRLRRMVEEEIRRSLAGTLRNQLTLMLPELLKEPVISQQICGIIALESVSHPGVMGELTGLRAFLRRELKIAVEALAKDLQPV